MIGIFAAYLRERFRLAIYGPLIALLVIAALWANGGIPSLATIILCASLAGLLLLQFRLWDDLEDRESDQIAHPTRVLACASAAPFRLALAALTCTNIALVAAIGSRFAIVALTALDLGFWLAYRRARRLLPDLVWRFQILLFKYPAFVALLAAVAGTAQAGRLIAGAFAIYVFACAYEVLHTQRETPGVIS